MNIRALASLEVSLRCNFATFLSCSFLFILLLVVYKRLAMIRICEGQSKDSSLFCTAHFLEWALYNMQQHFARTRVGMQCLDHAVQYRLSTYLPSYQCQWMHLKSMSRLRAYLLNYFTSKYIHVESKKDHKIYNQSLGLTRIYIIINNM